MEKLVKAGVAAAVLGIVLAGAGIFYYFVVFLPGIERQKLEMAQEEQKAQASKAEQDKRDATQREAQKKQLYEACKSDARANDEADWANACKDVASTNAQGLQNCLSDKNIGGNPYLGENYCKRLYGGADASSTCTLPSARADGINKAFQEAQQKCLAEAQLGM